MSEPHSTLSILMLTFLRLVDLEVAIRDQVCGFTCRDDGNADNSLVILAAEVSPNLRRTHLDC